MEILNPGAIKAKISVEMGELIMIIGVSISFLIDTSEYPSNPHESFA